MKNNLFALLQNACVVVATYIPSSYLFSDDLHVSFTLSRFSDISFSSTSGKIYLMRGENVSSLSPENPEFKSLDPMWNFEGSELTFSSYSESKEEGAINLYKPNRTTLQRVFTASSSQCRYPQFMTENRIVFAMSPIRRPYTFGGELWFNWDLWSVDIETKKLVKLTDQKFNSIDSISVDTLKSRIYFTAISSDTSFSELYVFDLDQHGSNVERVIKSDGYKDEWSCCYDAASQDLIFVSDKEKRFWQKLFRFSKKNGISKIEGLPHSKFFQSPRMSFDGNQLFFLSEESYDARNLPLFALWKLDFRTSTSTKVADSGLFLDPDNWIKAKAKSNDP